MTTTKRTLAILGGMLALGLGCGDPPPVDTDAGTDAGTTGGFLATCESYCDTVTANCSGANAQYADRAECITLCTAAGWATGEEVTATGPLSGNTLGCRTYHGGAPASDDPDTHCVHAGPTGADTCGTYCEAYCSLALGGCTGGNQLYANGEDCAAACAAFDDSGAVGATSGDTVQCRLYHLGVAITTGMTELHCPHAAPDGGGVCVGGWTFRTDDPTSYTRVDRMGMPAVATALVTSDADKEAYNDADPTDDGDPFATPAGTPTFAGELIANLTALHTAIDDDLIGLGLTPCSMLEDPLTGLPMCLSQRVAGGTTPRVVELVLPDTLTVNTSAAAGFPNGRGLSDQAIDVTLAVILLDMTVHNPGTLAGVPVNPDENDVAFLDDFPYLAAPHAP